MLLRLIRTYTAPYRRQLAAVVGLQTISVLASLYLPTLNARIIDQGISKGDIHYIWTVGAWMLAVTLGQAVCAIASVYFGAQAAMAAGRDLRAAMVDAVSGMSSREVGTFGAPSLITRTTNDVSQVQLLIVMSVTIMVMAPIMCVGGVIMALRENLELSWVLLVAVPILAITMGLIIVRAVPGFRQLQRNTDEVNRVLREQITGIRVVRAFVRERTEVWRFRGVNADLSRTATALGRLMAFMFPGVMLISNVTSVAVLWFGAHEVNKGTLQIGSLTAMLSYIMQILMAVMMASFMAMMVPRASVSAERLCAVFDVQPSVAAPAKPQHFAETGHGAVVEFDGAGFTYPGAEQPVLSGLGFTARPGTVTAIVGSTGVGKTTLVNLVPRLIDVTAGAVRVDGIDIRDVDPAELRARIGLVPQRPYLFSGTVAENLRFGKPDASTDELWTSLRIAQAADFVTAMPDGLDTAVAQGGTTVSGGQRQRLQIARAVVRRPDIYLFDDSFSALDLVTDARVRAELRAVTAEATVIMVAQRVSTIVDADQIVVLEDGKIVGVGTHQDLLRSCACYAEIVESQYAGGMA